MILRIWAGSVMTAMTDMRDPQRGQARTSIAWTLASSRVQALRRQSASTSWSFAAPESVGSADAVRPYQLAGARERRAGRRRAPPWG
jgi:hypothetical protein